MPPPKNTLNGGTSFINNQTQKVERVGGVRWTIKDGIVYDAKALLADVRAMVKADKEALGMDPKIPMKVEH